MLPSAKISDFDYELPQELIAQYPLSNRSSSRLITVDAVAQKIIHQQFKDILDILKPQDLLIFNDTKVLPSRFFGEKMTGGKIECLIERILSPQTALVHLRASKAPKDGTVLIFAEGLQAEVIGRQGRLFELRFHTDQSIRIFKENQIQPMQIAIKPFTQPKKAQLPLLPRDCILIGH
jgi:S-adenosylmethionine:tRNA ribosyltransferase-isomerase